jgi:hypothetical protein
MIGVLTARPLRTLDMLVCLSAKYFIAYSIKTQRMKALLRALPAYTAAKQVRNLRVWHRCDSISACTFVYVRDAHVTQLVFYTFSGE